MLRQRNPDMNPMQVVLPSKTITLGMPLSGSLSSRAEEETLDENLLVFATPGDEQHMRARVFCCLLYFLMPADIVLVTSMFFGGTIIDAPFSLVDLFTYLCTLATLIIGLLAVRYRHNRTLAFFRIVFYVDAIMNLVRVYSITQFSHFILQIAICHIVTQLRNLLLPSWFVPNSS